MTYNWKIKMEIYQKLKMKTVTTKLQTESACIYSGRLFSINKTSLVVQHALFPLLTLNKK
jgi:hypothetical protein